MKINASARKCLIGMGFSLGVLLASGTAGAAPFNGISDPATDLPGASLGSISITSGFIESKSQYFHPDFGDDATPPGNGLGDATVETSMESAAWFGANIAPVGQLKSGNCDEVGSMVTCDKDTKSGIYSGTLANLFVVHIGGKFNDGGCANPSDKNCKHTGGIILAFLYSSLIDKFDVSGFTNGVSWIRAFTAPDKLETNVVPLPGGILLLISALGGLGFLARFRKAGAKA